jgi:tRNA (guanine37-N1)-methyltransferase
MPKRAGMVRRMSPLQATFITLFPESLQGMLEASILGRAQRDGHLVVHTIQPRDHATDVHRSVDDSPCGGGAGMVMRVDVLARAIGAARAQHPGTRVICLDARGPRFDHRHAQRLAGHDALSFVCGRYEGVDARVFHGVDEVLSLGDFVLTGGELAALCVLDGVVRLRAGVLGNASSAAHDSFGDGLLEHRQYTKPMEHAWGGVPAVLRGGDHDAIAKARRRDSLRMTMRHRPDLFVRRRANKSEHKHWDDARVASLDPLPGDDG